MFWVEEKDITFQCELSQIQDGYAEIYQHFMDNDDEICYVKDKGRLYGIISIGDLYRFYLEERKSAINVCYCYVHDVNFQEAQRIFDGNENIHEIPVVQNEKFIGVIKSEGRLSEKEWKQGRASIQLWYQGEYQWRRRQLEKFIPRLKGRLYLYDLPSYDDIKNQINNQDKELFCKKASNRSGFSKMSEEEQKAFWGKDYTSERVEAFCSEHQKIRGEIHNGVYYTRDFEGTYFHFQNGYRQVLNATKQASKKIYVFGPCIIVGAYVTDCQTIEYYLQKMLLDAGYQDYEVVNCGLFGPEYVWGSIVTEKIANEDIVIIVDLFKFYYQTLEKMSEKCKRVYRGSLSQIYLEVENPFDNIYDDVAHCNSTINEKIAQRFFCDLEPILSNDKLQNAERMAIQNYYISWDVVSYFRSYCKQYQVMYEADKRVGSIVMNCNPFTKGHRYLIERALAFVDLLYVFVVEEDKSIFKFEDRIEMVRRGTADLPAVRVLPSGKYILSQETFSQYFQKDVVEQVDDIDYDVRIFGEVVAQEIGIKVRFVGEEPFDKVTRKYNETMKRILPEYGIEVIEIPRISTRDGSVISASAVRKAMDIDDKELLQSMLPESTLKYLME